MLILQRIQALSERGNTLKEQRLLELALKGLEADRARLEEEIAQVRAELNGNSRTQTATFSETSGTPTRKRRPMSRAARKRISEGMKRRYAELRKAAEKKSNRPVNLGRGIRVRV
jgi:hypothetical protein